MSKSATHEREDEIDMLNGRVEDLLHANKQLCKQVQEFGDEINKRGQFINDEIIRLLNLFRKVENISNLNSDDADGDHESMLDIINSISQEALWGRQNATQPKGGNDHAMYEKLSEL